MNRWAFVRYFAPEDGAGSGDAPLNDLEQRGIVAQAEEAAEEVATEIVQEAEVDQWQRMNSILTEMESRLFTSMNGIHDRLSLLENPPTPEPELSQAEAETTTTETVTEIPGENVDGPRESLGKQRFKIF